MNRRTARIELADENGNTQVKRKSKKWKCFSTEFKFIFALQPKRAIDALNVSGANSERNEM